MHVFLFWGEQPFNIATYIIMLDFPRVVMAEIK